MITSISLNPSIDRTLVVDGFAAGSLNRVVTRSDVAAGKGINVALTVSALGLDSECIGIMYRDSAPLFEKRLMLNSTAYDFAWCEGSVRTNIKVFDRTTGVVTELNESGANVDEATLKASADLVMQHAENSDFLVMSGSLPPGCPPDFYKTLITAVDGLGCRCLLDADGERLKYGLEAAPYMIKPNHLELEMIAGKKLTTLKDIRNAAYKYLDLGVQVIAVSLGADGAMITNGGETLYAPKMNIEVKSTVGAGDSMVAGLAAGFVGDNELEDSFRMGVACATARCMTEGSRIMDRTVYKALLDMVTIERI